MPWNAFITAADYYSKQFPGKHVDRLITVSYLPINLAVLGLLLSRDSQRESSWSYLRIMIGFCMYSVTMFLVPLMDVLGIISLIPMLFLVFLSGAADVRHAFHASYFESFGKTFLCMTTGCCSGCIVWICCSFWRFSQHSIIDCWYKHIWVDHINPKTGHKSIICW